jgi:trk system potassium uptake protein TrkH
MINKGIISYVIGSLLMLLGAMMLSVLPFSIYYDDGAAVEILGAALITIAIGSLGLFFRKHKNDNIGKREGYLIVALAWVSVGIFSSVPYIVCGIFPNLTDAFFESVSGLTTTGATVLTDIEIVPEGVLFWRSLTQWIGGMGIIVLTVAIFPLLGIGGVELFVAESPGPKSSKIHPRIKETAKRLWLIYVGLTLLLSIVLVICGMGWFDAFNHALTAMATGGFSTKNASIAAFANPAVEYVLTLFMFVGGVNYTLIYFGIRGRFSKVWESSEFKTYFLVMLTTIIVVTTSIMIFTDYRLEHAFRAAAFQVVSVITTTGFITEDYTSWTSFLTLIFFVLLFIGGCGGSTSGGIKMIRHLVFFKNSTLEFKQLMHPNALVRVKVDNQLVHRSTLTHIISFVLIYLVLFVIGSVIMAGILYEFSEPFESAVGAVATSLGNVGPAIGNLGPVDNFSIVPTTGKWVLLVLMLLGRLELFTILILFTPYFWRSN